MRNLLTVPVLAVSSVALQAGSIQVTAVRAFTFPGITRVAIEVNGEFTYKADRVHNPERLFFDLKGAVPSIEGRSFLHKIVGDNLVKQIRVAEMQPGLTRVVLDLESDVDFTASQLSSPNRLIVEVHAVGETHPPAPSVTSAAPPPVRPPLEIAKVADRQALGKGQQSQQSVLPPGTPPPGNASVVVPQPTRAPVLPTRDHEVAVAPAKEPEPVPPVVMPAMGPAARVAQLGHNASLTRALGLKVNRIVIDAGHGGHDQGTTGPNGMLEKDLVLDVALRLGKLVEDRMNAEVVYTRSDDTFIPLEERTAIANRNHADLFISIHANSSPAPEVVGVETYYLNFTNSPEAMNVAARENAVSDKSVFELKDLIQKISLHDKAEESKAFAAAVQASMQSYTIRYFPTARDRGVRKAPFVVLIGASMPSILAEIGFLTNTRQERLLSKSEFRQHLSEVLYRGIHNYTQTLSHFDEVKQTAETRTVGATQ